MPDQATPAGNPAARRIEVVCYYCSSTDTMEPFRRPPEIPVVTRILPRLRRRYCRTCGRHFICWAPRPR